MAESLGMTETTLTQNDLLAQDIPTPELPITVLSGEGVLKLGTVLGKITKGAISIAAVAGNTGTGVPGAITRGAKAMVGVYSLVCIAAATDAGTFAVYDPDGRRLKDLTVAAAYDNGHFAITIADGTDFVVGDKFNITVAAGSGKYKAYDNTETDGTDVARVILGRDIDATSADVKAFGYVGGSFREAALTGIDAAGKEDLLLYGIVVK